MFSLRAGYILSGFTTGLLLLLSFLTSLPDGKLHITMCDVGQGDAVYIRFPDGRDMLVDGGPNERVLTCLGRAMPFWDRTLDLVVLTHPENDHMRGLPVVFARYRVGYFIRSDADSHAEGFPALMTLVKRQGIQERLVAADEQVTVGETTIAVVGPSAARLAGVRQPAQSESLTDQRVLGAAAGSVNEASVVLWLRYGAFDGLLTGDATMRGAFSELADTSFELLKVPHHGSKTAMTTEFLDWLRPELAIISVGNNSYGHPASEILTMLANRKTQVLRTDTAGDIEVISDGVSWTVRKGQ